MPTPDKHEHGTFSWVELTTPDPEAAKAFYAEVLRWTFEDRPSGADANYTVCSADGKVACAIQKLSDENAKPQWLAYVTVDDIDERTKRVIANGGQVVQEPIDVATAGRMAIALDPLGARFALWEPKSSIGAEIVFEPGALAWNELYSNDLDRSGKFYIDTFGWVTELADMGVKGMYTLFNRPTDSTNASGMMTLPAHMATMPPHWLTYFAVEDVDAATKKVDELGGKTVVAGLDIPVGRFAIVRDPQGITFGLFKAAY